jgi:hypothetical protein
MCSRTERTRRRVGSFLDVLLNHPTTNRIREKAAAEAFRWDRGVSDDARRLEFLGGSSSSKAEGLRRR